jgi:hypothetical protein
MSYPAIASALPALPSAVRVDARQGRALAGPPIGHRHPAQLLEWLRLAAREVFGPGIPGMRGIARLEPYRPCRRCVSQIRWCGAGEALGPANPPNLASLASDVSPLTSALLLGTKADPYPPAEAARQQTRALLEWIARIPDPMEISILTRSPLLLRDLDLLAALDQRHTVTVSVLIPAADPKLAARLERRGHPAAAQAPGADSAGRARGADDGNGAGSASPAASASPVDGAGIAGGVPDRFALVRALAAHGLAVQVLCTPIVPGRNNSAAALHRLFGLAHQAGACDVRPAPRHPALPPTSADSRHLLALFHRLRAEHGFPRALPGRG